MNAHDLLYPLPDGTIVCAVDPHTKKCYFERHTDFGVEKLNGVPEGCKVPDGYVVGKRRSSAKCV